MTSDTRTIHSFTGLLLNKVPEVTIYFWLIKVLSTTVGETAADFLGTNLNLGLTTTSLIMAGLSGRGPGRASSGSRGTSRRCTGWPSC